MYTRNIQDLFVQLGFGQWQFVENVTQQTRQVVLARVAENRIFNENRWRGEEEQDVGTHCDDLVIINDPPGEELHPQ